MNKKKILSLSLCFCLLSCFTACGAKENSSLSGKEAKYKDFSVTIFSDVHYGTHNYNNFACTDGLNKLGKIIEETPNSDFYINLGDFIDNMGKSLTLFNEAADFLKGKNIEIYNTGKVFSESSRIMYTLTGNHEVNTFVKADLASVIPYVENVGQVFHFEHEGVLFVAIDGNYSSENGSDAMADMYCTSFTIPEAQRTWFKNVIDNNLDDDIQEVVLLSHIAGKNFSPQSVFWELIDYVADNYGTHVTMFDGHTHTRAYNDYTRDDDGTSYFTEYTLPAVTSNNFYDYYTVYFKNGKVDNVYMYLEKELG